jgi:hypothetical protein
MARFRKTCAAVVLFAAFARPDNGINQQTTQRALLGESSSAAEHFHLPWLSGLNHRLLKARTISNEPPFESCDAIIASLRELAVPREAAGSRKSIVFQCRSVHGGLSDDCGGFG